jgi:hypothetical protein
VRRLVSWGAYWLVAVGLLWAPHGSEKRKEVHTQVHTEYWEVTRYGIFGYYTVEEYRGGQGSWSFRAGGRIEFPVPPPKMTYSPGALALTVAATLLVIVPSGAYVWLTREGTGSSGAV